MNKYFKGFMSVVPKVFALFLIISILFPAHTVLVIAQTVEDAVTTEVAPTTAPTTASVPVSVEVASEAIPVVVVPGVDPITPTPITSDEVTIAGESFGSANGSVGGNGKTLCERADFNNDGSLTHADFDAFQTAFENGDPSSDFDQNGVMNVNDFMAFMNAYAGCQPPPLENCLRVDINHDGILSSLDFAAFQTAFENEEPIADFDVNGSRNVLDFAAFMNLYAACPHQAPGSNATITVSPISGITTEAGGSFTFAITLDPNFVTNVPVTINVSSSNTSEGTLSTNTVVLDYKTPVATVLVTGVDDSIDDGDKSYTITTSPAVSTNPHYNNVNVPDISVVNLDNDEGGSTGGNNGGNSGGGSSGGGGGSGGQIIPPNGRGGQVLGASTVNSGVCNYLSGYLKMGANNNFVEVMKLQSFLKTSEGFSNLVVNGNFDAATFNAVKAFQVKYGTDVLIPWGYDTDQSTGYVYILTQKKINELFCKTEFPITSSQQNEILSFKSLIKGFATIR